MRSTKIKKTFAVLVYWRVYIMGSQNKITDFFMLLAWLSRFNHDAQLEIEHVIFI